MKSKILLLSSCLLIYLSLIFAWVLRQNWSALIMLQNSDEMRATGGFLGSVAWCDGRALIFVDCELIDIYQLDDQLPTFPAAPAAVQTYLTGGRDELHLQDANWDRDFPTSARRVAAMAAQARRQDEPDLVIALNSSLVATVIDDLTGVTVNDVTLTSDNFTYEARRDHEIVNPWRQAKTIWLKEFATQLVKRFCLAPSSQKLTVVKNIISAPRWRGWQVWSKNAWWQNVFELLGITGATKQSPTCHTIYQVPSNVGINKSNRLTQTTASLLFDSSTPQQAQVIVATINNNQADDDALLTERQHFANYQRLLIDVGVAIESITVNDLPVATYDARLITDSQQQTWQEIGFLVITDEEASTTTKIDLQAANGCWQLRD